MTPSRNRRRLLALPAIGLAGLLTVPVAAGADSGRGNGSKSEASTTAAPTITTAVAPSESSISGAPTSDPTGVASTSVAPTGISPTSSVPGRNKDVLKFLSDLVTMLERAKVSEEVRNALLPRVRAMRDAVAAGALPTQTDLQALSGEVLAAVGRSSGRTPSTTAPVAPSTSAVSPTAPPTAPPVAPSSSSPRSGSTGGGRQLDPAKVASQLDEWVKKIGASALSEADQAALLASIESVRSLATDGTLTAADLATLKAVVGSALERSLRQEGPESDETSTSTPSSNPSSNPSTIPEDAPAAVGSDDAGRRPSGKLAVDAAIAAVTNSPLPDGVKQNILGVLTQAKSILDDATLTPDQAAEQLRRLRDAEKAQRLTEAAGKLVTFSQKIAVLAFDSGTLPGAGEVIVVVHDKLAQANELLASPILDIATVKSAWKLLHEARTLLQQFLESSTSTTGAPTTIADGATAG